MNIEGFYHCLNASEKKDLIKFVSGLIKESVPEDLVLTPVHVWQHVNRRRMSTRLRNVFKVNRNRIPRYVESMSKEEFMSLKGAGPKMWWEFSAIMDIHRQEVKRERSDYDNDTYDSDSGDPGVD